MNRVICLRETFCRVRPFRREGRPSVDGRRGERVAFRVGQPTGPWRRGGAHIFVRRRVGTYQGGDLKLCMYLCILRVYIIMCIKRKIILIKSRTNVLVKKIK